MTATLCSLPTAASSGGRDPPGQDQRQGPHRRLPSSERRMGLLCRKPLHVSVCLLEILPDRDVIPSLFDDQRQMALDRAIDSVKDRWGRGTITTEGEMGGQGILKAEAHSVRPAHGTAVNGL